MKPMLAALTIAGLVAVAACTQSGEPAASNDSGNNSASSEVDAAYERRHENFERMGDALKAINRELKASAPDLEVVRREASSLASLAPQIPDWFPQGTGSDAHPRTRAKAEIWSDQAGFREVHARYAERAERFNAAATAGDVAALQAQGADLGNGCRDCHQRYRGPER